MITTINKVKSRSKACQNQLVYWASRSYNQGVVFLVTSTINLGIPCIHRLGCTDRFATSEWVVSNERDMGVRYFTPFSTWLYMFSLLSNLRSSSEYGCSSVYVMIWAANLYYPLLASSWISLNCPHFRLASLLSLYRESLRISVILVI